MLNTEVTIRSIYHKILEIDKKIKDKLEKQNENKIKEIKIRLVKNKLISEIRNIKKELEFREINGYSTDNTYTDNQLKAQKKKCEQRLKKTNENEWR